MKKTLSLVKMLKTGLSLFVDLSLFIYLVVTSAVAGVAEGGVGSTVAFSLVLAWFIWAAAVILSVLIVKNFKKGVSTANQAKTTAEGAASTASTAQSTAEGAATAASTAQATADSKVKVVWVEQGGEAPGTAEANSLCFRIL